MAQTFKLLELESFPRGDTPIVRFPLTLNKVPYDLSGYTKAFFTMTSQSNPASPSADSGALFQKIMEPIANPTLGILEFQLTIDDTNTGDPTITYYWDIELVDVNNIRVHTPILGTFKFITDFTRGS